MLNIFHSCMYFVRWEIIWKKWKIVVITFYFLSRCRCNTLVSKVWSFGISGKCLCIKIISHVHTHIETHEKANLVEMCTFSKYYLEWGKRPFLCTSVSHPSGPPRTILQAEASGVRSQGPWQVATCHPPIGRHIAASLLRTRLHLLPVDLCWEKTLLLISLTFFCMQPSPLPSDLSPYLVRSLFVIEVVSLSFVHSTAPVTAFGFCCYCRETKILWAL